MNKPDGIEVLRQQFEVTQKELEEMRKQLAETQWKLNEALAVNARLQEDIEVDGEAWFDMACRFGPRSEIEKTFTERDNFKTRLEGNLGGQGHISKKLVTLRQVADLHWKNADPGDPSTHPSAATVERTLLERDFGKRTAQEGASIIRPDWARDGRPKQKE